MIERCDHMHCCEIVPFDWGNINGRFIVFYGFDSRERAEMAVARFKESNITAHILPRFAPGEIQAWVDAMPETKKDKLVSALEEIDDRDDG